MDYLLQVVRGRSATEALKLVDGVTTLGRHDDCQIRIKSSQVSRRHCEFFEKKGLLLVKDLGSANGTFVNGKKVQGQQVLEPGDELTIGTVTLRVAKVGQALPEATKPATSAADTAVVEAIAVEGEAEAIIDDDEFEISFDDEPAQAVEDEVADILLSEPAPAPAAAAKPAEPAEPAEPPKAAKAKDRDEPAAKPAPEPEPAPAESADEAIADFLLDIKIDEDE